jgi:hypothetical protein
MIRIISAAVTFLVSLSIAAILINNLTYAIEKRFAIDGATSNALFLAGITLAIGIASVVGLAVWRRLAPEQANRPKSTRR